MATQLSTEALVVGGGVAGLASAWHLARAGRRVVLVESEAQFGVHSSGQNAAILRTLIADEALTRIGRASAERLHRPPAGFADAPLVRSTGLLLSADAACRDELFAWPGVVAPAPYDECRIEVLTRREFARLQPAFAAPPDGDPGDPFGLLLPGEGQLDVAAIVAGFAAGARSASAVGGRDAELLCGVEVRRLLADSSGAACGAELADGRRIEADQVLVAAGAWAGAMARELGSTLGLAPRRRHLAVTSPSPDIDHDWPVVWNLGTDFYARPESGGLLICGCDETLLEPSGPPSRGACPRDAAALELVAERAARFLPAFADARVASWWAGWRTFTEPAGHPFALGPDPDVAGLFWAAGLGGHGMTSCFEVGRLAARELQLARGARPGGELEGEPFGDTFRPRPGPLAGATLA
ncbi:MAG: FAD-binding oxidoreductase [Planctomycetota bacterium]|nr:FAD-binding oxidoreductase [Planctomycetota bacterium]